MNIAWSDLVTDVMMDGIIYPSRNGQVKELLGTQLEVPPNRSFLFHPGRKLSPIYAAAEFLWLLGSDPGGEMICHYAPSYKNYLNDGKAWGHYGMRLNREGQIQRVVDHLRADPDSRRAVVSMWVPTYDLRGPEDGKINDIPCTLSIQFLIRNDKLHTVVTMRSNDLWMGLPYDVFVFSGFSRLIAEQLRLKMGTYYHNAGSSHIYEKHWNRAREAMAMVPQCDMLTFEPHVEGSFRDYNLIRQFELAGRDGTQDLRIADHFGEHTLLTNCLLLASLHGRPEPLSDSEFFQLSCIIDSRLLRVANEILLDRRRK